jgi:hypothetical protein
MKTKMKKSDVLKSRALRTNVTTARKVSLSAQKKGNRTMGLNKTGITFKID